MRLFCHHTAVAMLTAVRRLIGQIIFNHTSCMALSMAVLVSLFTSLVQTEISQLVLVEFAMTFSTNIPVHLRMIYNNFGGPLTFNLAPSLAFITVSEDCGAASSAYVTNRKKKGGMKEEGKGIISRNNT